MPKNTFLLIAILAVFAALVVGVNIGKITSKSEATTQKTPTVAPTQSVTPTPARVNFTGCGIALTYPATLTKLDIETGGAMLIDSTDTKKSIAIACQKDIPKPALATDKIDPMKIGSVSASLYHDASEKDGTPVDKLMFRHPKTGLDVYISGFGVTYDDVLSTIYIQ